ncbi:MAG: hypothetical protein ACE5IK_09255, partial [Acidobacteriota bacterium]
MTKIQNARGSSFIYVYYARLIQNADLPPTSPFSEPSVYRSNVVTTTPPNIRYIGDSTGRLIEIRYDDPGLLGDVNVLVPGPDGTRAEYDLYLGQQDIVSPQGASAYQPNGSGGCTTQVTPDPHATVATLDQVVDPLGNTLSFDYLGPDCLGFGSVRSRTLPTGARSEYEYATYSHTFATTLGYSLTEKRFIVPGSPIAVWQYARDPVQLFLMGLPAPPKDSGTFWWDEAFVDYPNPPQVFEVDPDGNRTVYHLQVAQGLNPKQGQNGMTWAIERLRGTGNSAAQDVVSSRQDYTYENGDPYTEPFDPRTTPTVRHGDVRRKATRTQIFRSDGTIMSKLVESSDYLDFGLYRTQTEYALNSETQAFRTTRTAYLIDPNNPDVLAGVTTGVTASSLTGRWILNAVSSTQVERGGTGEILSRTVTTLVNVYGQPRVTRAYPDPAKPGVYVQTTNHYDSLGRLDRSDVVDVGGPTSVVRTTRFTLDDAGRVLYKEFGPSGTFTWKAFDRDVDHDTGLVTATRSPAGVQTKYFYDALGRLTSIEPSGTELPTTISYPTLQQTIVTQGSGTDRIESQYHYDAAGRLIRQDRLGTSGQFDSQETAYDVAGRKVFESEWVPFGTASPPGTTFEYWVPLIGAAGPVAPGTDPSFYRADPQGRVTRVTAADGAVTETTYDGLTTTVVVKDLNRSPGSGAAVSAPTESVTVYTNDAFGRLVGVNAAAGTDATYSYDLLDRLTKVEMGTQARSFAYDALGRLLTSSNPENGLVTFDAYDPTGLLLQKTDAAGIVTQLAYDAAGRIITETRGNTGQVLKQFSYDTPLGGALDQAAGRLVAVDTMTDLGTLFDPAAPPAAAVRRELVYEGLNGRLSEEHMVFEGGAGSTDTLTTQYAYNTMGRLSQVDYPHPASGGQVPLTVDYTYRNGFLVNVGDGLTASTFVQDVTYNPAGGKEFVLYGNGTENVITPDVRNRPTRFLVRAFDQQAALQAPTGDEVLRWAGQRGTRWRPPGRDSIAAPGRDPAAAAGLPTDLLAQIEVCPPEGCPAGGGGGSAPPPPPVLVDTWDSGVYTYDGAGNIIDIGADTFTYDALSRLTGATVYNLPGGSSVQMSYSFDGFGNMIQRTKTVPGSTYTWNFTHDGGNHLTNLVADFQSAIPTEDRNMSYDPVGNLVADGRQRYIFDDQGRLTEVRHDNEDSATDPENGTVLGRYGYDERGYRVTQQADGIETFYVRDLQGRVLSEFRRPISVTTAPVWDRDYVYALGGAVALVKNQIPQAPTGFVSAWTDNAGLMDVTLTWDKSNEVDISSYRIYRNDQWIDSVFQVSVTDPVTYQDTGLAPGIYEYHVVTVDTAGHLSPDSRHLTLDASDPLYTFATWLSPDMTAADQSLDLHWDVTPADAARVVGYWVYRQGPGETAFSKITPVLLVQPGFLDLGLTNNDTYSYKVVVRNTRGLDSPLTDPATETHSGVPVDTVPPAPPASLTTYPGPAVDTATLRWSPSYAPDLAGYAIYRVAYNQQVYATSLFSAAPDLYRINFTSSTGEDVAGYNKAVASTTWPTSGVGVSGAGQMGWIDTFGVGEDDWDDPNSPDERIDSANHWYSTGQGTKTFRVSVDPTTQFYLVEVGVGRPSLSSWPHVSVNGVTYWDTQYIASPAFVTMQRLVQPDAAGHIDISIGGGTSSVASMTYITYVIVRSTTPDPKALSATLVDLTVGGDFVVRAFDDDGNMSADSPMVTAYGWRDTGGLTVTDGSGDTNGRFDIYPWGYARYPDANSTLHAFADPLDYGQDFRFYAANLAIDDPNITDPNRVCSYLIYRQEPDNSWKLLTDPPVYSNPASVVSTCGVSFFDTDVSQLTHTYRITSSEGKGQEVTYTWAHDADPQVVVGQYAYGAALVRDDVFSNDSNLAINMNGTWELGELPPYAPVVVTWARGYHPDVAGYRVWVKDENRQTAPLDWTLLAEIPDSDVTMLEDPDAMSNWPVLQDPNSIAGIWDMNSCFVSSVGTAHESPCWIDTDYLSHYYVQAVTATDLAGPPVQPNEPSGGSEWATDVRAVRVAYGECPDRNDFCQSCPTSCPWNGSCPTGTCAWPASSAKELEYLINFTDSACMSETFDLYENVSPQTAWPSPGGFDGTGALGWLDPNGVWSTYIPDWDLSCRPLTLDPRFDFAHGIRNQGAGVFKRFRMQVEANKMYYVKIAGGDCLSRGGISQRLTVAVNGVTYWSVVQPQTWLPDSGTAGWQWQWNGEIAEHLIQANAQGYIDVDIGGDTGGLTSNSCLSYLTVRRESTQVAALPLPVTDPRPEALHIAMNAIGSPSHGVGLAIDDAVEWPVFDEPDPNPPGSPSHGTDTAQTALQRHRADGRWVSPATSPGDYNVGIDAIGHLEVVTMTGAQFGPTVAVTAATDSGRLIRPLAPDRLVGAIPAVSTVEWLHPDHLGSTRVITDEAGFVVSQHKYLPFGEEYPASGGASPNTHKFTGHERDRSTGLDYMYARYYGPQNLFRFL